MKCDFCEKAKVFGIFRIEYEDESIFLIFM